MAATLHCRRRITDPPPVAAPNDRLPQARRPRPLATTDRVPWTLDVRAIRLRLRFTQRQFAECFGFPVATLRHWERRDRSPTGTALVLLQVIAANPRVVLQAVRKARRDGATR